MNKTLFYQYMHHPELLDERSLTEIENILEAYPYFQSARLLHIKNLCNQGSISYNRELKKTAVWITDRSQLFYLLDERVLLPVDDYSDRKKQNTETSIEDSALDFSALSEVTEFASKREKTKAELQNDELSQLIMSGAAQSSTFFNVDDKVDLESFVKTFKKRKPDDDAKVDAIEEKSEHRKKLIDSFIFEQPKIAPVHSKKEEYDLSPPDDKNADSDMITDTLAKIYINQGKYEKAILAYEKLSLKYPRKNIYFAGQIQQIKELINNQ
ncbi:MAG: hypothetical protein PF517_11920 [Salinivirgaceae bacterium]|jgi:hypothetical protein|nr:hypothetical protein [Salinivirgaceae bacterium]